MAKSRAWKDHERRTAAILNGERTSQPYANLPDVVAGDFVVECKEREALPKWIMDAMAQVVGHAREGQLPLVVLHQKHKHQRNDLVVLRMRDFKEWFCEMPEVRRQDSGREDDHHASG
jgi:hypothetical protein